MHKPERRHAALGYVSQLRALYRPKLVSEGGGNTPLLIRNGTQPSRLSESRKAKQPPEGAIASNTHAGQKAGAL